MRRCLVVAIAVCLFGVCGAFVFVGAAQEQQQGDSNGDLLVQVKRLQKERIETLEELLSICSMQYRQGNVGFDVVAAAQDELIDAQLQSSDKPDERIALLKKQLEVASDVLTFSTARYNAARATRVDVCRARAHYLDVSIKLLSERSKQRGGAK